MNKYKKLVGNSLIFAIGNLGSKLMQFIMIPLYSYTMTTVQYGKADLLTTIVSLILPIISLDIFDAVFRYSLDKNDNTKVTFNIGLSFTVLMAIVSFPLSLVLQSFINGYPIVCTDYVLVATMLFSLISNYARAINRVREFAIAGIVNSFAMGGLNLLLLLVFHLRIIGYLVSMATGMIVASIYLCWSCHLWDQVDYHVFDKKKFREMLKYSIPLVPNLLAWWLNSASDRVFILAFLGPGANGIYAMANKIPNVLSTLMSIFLQSWQISVVQEYEGQKGKQFITNVFQTFLTVMFIIAIGIVMLIRPIFHLLVSPAYYVGWQVAPFLILSIIYSNLASFLGTIYTATKKTVPIMYTTVIGAVVNVAASLTLIPIFHLAGAAFANITSFGIVSFLRLRDIIKQRKIEVQVRHFVYLHLLFIICMVINFIVSNVIWSLATGVVAILFLLADQSLKGIRQTVKQKLLQLIH